MPLHFLLPDAAGALLGEPTDAQPGDAVVLTGAEAHHAAAVRRVRVGEEVTVGDGRGTWLTGTVRVRRAARGRRARSSARTDTAAPHPRIVLAQALAKGDRDELAVQAATELGVDEIVPWQAARSVSRWDAAKAEKGRARWSTIVREAAKQAHRAWLPEVAPLATAGTLADRARGIPCRRPRAERRDSADRARTALAATSVTSFSSSGPRAASHRKSSRCSQRAGASLVRLGDTVLRTSTAGPGGPGRRQRGARPLVSARRREEPAGRLDA